MDAERWQRLRRHLEELLPLEDAERQVALQELEQRDAALAAELESWLPYAETTDDFLSKPVFDIHQQGELGRRFGPYRTVEWLGRGGMGSVFLARHDDGERPVALKVMRSGVDAGAILRRFQTERQILAALDHPGIARILDGGSDEEGRPYFVMEAVRGQPIDAFCETGALDLAARLRLFQDVCRAVQQAHASLVVHCDLKPSNILITEDGAPKLLDFGIAKVLRGGAEVTTDGHRPLTLQYASPEQVRGEAITTACDLYALGALLYLLLSGVKPYDLSRMAHGEAVRAICDDDPSPPSAAASEAKGLRWGRRLRGDLDSIVLQAMAKEPRRRYGSVEQLVDDIDRHLQALPVRARPSTWLYRTGRFVRRHTWGVVAATLVVVSAVAAIILGFTAQAERDVAVAQRLRADAGAEFLVDIFRQTALATRQDPAATGDALQVQVMDRLADRAYADPLVRADILISVGTAQLGLGQLERAEELLEEARRLLVSSELEASQTFDDPSRRRLAKAANNLAGVYYRRGERQRAEKMYRLALVMWSARGQSSIKAGSPSVAGVEHAAFDADNAKTWSNLAVLLMGRGAFDEADEVLQNVLRLRRQRLATGQPQAARNLSRSLFHLGALRLQQQRLGAAETALTEALRLAAEGSELDQAKVRAKLIRLAVARGDIQGASELARRVEQDVDVSRLGNSWQQDLALLEIRRGEASAARQRLEGLLAERSAVTAKREVGETAYRHSLLACALLAEGRRDMAAELLKGTPSPAEVVASERGAGSLDAAEAACHLRAWLGGGDEACCR